MKPVSILSLSALTTLTTAHFLLNYPPTLGFDDSIEGTSPCGGFPVVFNSSDVQVQVDGFPIALRSTHPEADWLFRATLSQQEPFNWTNLLPVVHETGLGDFCIPDSKSQPNSQTRPVSCRSCRMPLTDCCTRYGEP
jgi:hypothetical protein